MAVKFLSGVNLEGNDLSNVGSIEASRATFARTVTLNDTIQSGEEEWYIESGGFAEFKESIRTPKGEIGVLDMQNSQYVDSPSGIIVFDMVTGAYTEDNLVSGIVFDGDDIKIRSSRDIIFQAFDSIEIPTVRLSDMSVNVNGEIIVKHPIDVNSNLETIINFGVISLYNSDGNETTCISADSDSWIGGNLSVHGTTFNLNDVIFTVDRGVLTIGTSTGSVNINSLSAAHINNVENISLLAESLGIEFYRNTYIRRNSTSGVLEINTDSKGVVFSDSITAADVIVNGESVVTRSAFLSLSNSITALQQSTFTGTEDVSYYRLTWFTSSGGARNVDIPTFYGKGFVSLEDALEANAPFMADAAFIEGIYSAIDTAKAEINTEAKAYADTIYNKLLTNPDETVNSITELLALIESNKDTLIKRYVYEFTGDGTKKTFICTHNLGTTNLVVTLYDADTNEVIQGDIQHISSNTTQVSFSTAPENNRPFKLVLLG